MQNNYHRCSMHLMGINQGKSNSHRSALCHWTDGPSDMKGWSTSAADHKEMTDPYLWELKLEDCPLTSMCIISTYDPDQYKPILSFNSLIYLTFFIGVVLYAVFKKN